MFTSKLPGGVFFAAVVIKSAEEKQNVTSEKVCRASELPIYGYDTKTVTPSTDSAEEKASSNVTALENVISTMRKELWTINHYIRQYKSEAEKFISDSSSSAVSAYKYLSTECDDTTRQGAIGLSAATGFILGLRGGIIRRLFYATLTGTAMASICYPRLAEEYSQDMIVQSRKYSTIAYNFVMGVKKDDIPIPMPEFPSLSGIWDKAGELSKSATTLITGGSEQKDSKQAPEKVATKSE